MMKNLLLTLLLSGWVPVMLPAQTADLPGESKPQASETTKAAEGTFQLVSTGKVREILQDEILRVIESNRDENLTVIHRLSEFTEVIIPPYSEIRKPDFQPLPLYKEN